MRSRSLSLVFVAVFVLFQAVVCVYAGDFLALQGNVKQGGVDLASGNLNVLIYDAASGGNLIYNSSNDFNNAIANGKYDVLLGNTSQELNLRYGQKYYFEIYVNGEKLNYSNGMDRQIFQSAVGNISSAYLNLSGGAYVPYVGASQDVDLGNNNFLVNGTTFFINATRGVVGIGTANPLIAKNLDLVAQDGINIRFTRYNAGATTGGHFTFRNARGTEASPSKMLINDQLYGNGISAYAGTFGVDGAFTSGGNRAFWAMYATQDWNNHTQNGVAQAWGVTKNDTGGFGSANIKMVLSDKGWLYLLPSQGNVFNASTMLASAQLHQDSGTATETYHKFTANETTGVLQTDGFDVGINGSGYAELIQRENLPIIFSTNNIERMRLTAAGNLGIGTNNPQAKLDVESTSGSGGAATIGSSFNSATGDYAIAMGDNAIASGNYSMAIGKGATAYGSSSAAIGLATGAFGDSSIATGEGTTAIGYASTAMGWYTSASGAYSTAMGVLSTATENYSTAMGSGTTASGIFSTAMGESTTASGAYSTAIGYYTIASGQYSTATGESTMASGESSTALGSWTTASGLASTATGYEADAQGDYSTAIGYFAIAAGNYSTAIGYYTFASGNISTSIGVYTNASGQYSTAMGYGTQASGSASTALGYNTLALGHQSTAMGEGTKANATWATAMGFLTIASGLQSTAMGVSTRATGVGSTTMGYGTQATGNVSTAMGVNTIASGNYSTAIGRNIICSQDNATCIGGGNVGIGTGNPTHTLNVVGDVNITGNLIVGGASLGGNYVPYINATQGVDLGNNTFSTNGTVTFDGGWQNGGITIDDGNIFAKVGYFYNITSLTVNNMNVNGTMYPGLPNQFDIGSPSLMWRNGYFSGDINISGETVSKWLYNQTIAANNYTNTQIATLNNSITGDYVPYSGATQNVGLGDYNLTAKNVNVTEAVYVKGSLAIENNGTNLCFGGCI